MTQVGFTIRGRNPDILSCIANLSSDEVFTPPDLANQMLDTLAEAWAANNGGLDLWTNSSMRFLDPFAKSGVFLREIVRRLTAGLVDEIPKLEDRVAHIASRQVFGIATTQLTSLMSRRSVYCSKWANGKHSIAHQSFDNGDGNIWFERTEHTWLPTGRCQHCAANEEDYERGTALETYAFPFIHAEDPNALVQKIFGADMRFDIVIGNPPYQLGSSGGEAPGSFAMPIYQRFVRSAKALEPRYLVMVTPSRWFAGGRGLDDFRAEMLADRHIRALVDYPDATEVFSGPDISGGVSYFLWDQSYDGPCAVRTVAASIPDTTVLRYLNAYDVLIRYNTGVAVVRKVWPNGVQAHNLGTKVSSIQPFGLRTAFRGKPSAKGMADPVKLRSSAGISFIERAEVPKNDAWIDQWKVILGRAYGERGSFPYWITSGPIILEPGSACTETYLVIGRFDSQKKAELFANFLRTRFVRFLISLRKNTQDIYNERFTFVPDLPMDHVWTDTELYAKYGLSQDEIAFIEQLVRPMEPPR